MTDKFKLINCNPEINKQPEITNDTKKLLYLGLNDEATESVHCSFPAKIINLCRTKDLILLYELVDTSDLKHIWGTVHAILDRAVENMCYGVILPDQVSPIVYFIFGVVHASYPSIYFYVLRKDSNDNSFLMQIS